MGEGEAMKAAQIKAFGHTENITVEDIEKPTPGAGQVLVEVYASSINPFDSMVREGMAGQIPLPFTLGGDVAGVVLAVGEGVTSLKSGDKVYGQAAAIAGESGALAEFAITKAESLALAPSNLSMPEAASIVLVGVSAIQALVEHMQLMSGQKLFVLGASGGIGSVAVQLGKEIGAYVAGAFKGDHTTFVRGLGADEAIDTEKQQYEQLIRDYDGVLELVRDEDWEKLLSVVKPGGKVVSLVGQPDESVSPQAHQVTVTAQMTRVNTERLNALRAHIENGAIKPQVDKVFSLDQVREAFAAREGGNISGKVVIEIKK